MKMQVRLFAFFGIAILLASCSFGPSMPESGRLKIGKPYQVKGKTYVPRYEPGYDQIGIASWYGPGFHGKRTANGEVYNQNDMTAAHPTLPMPSLVRVTNLVNGKSTVVRINDRGPFAEGRIIDLSKAAAKQIGLDHMGICKVRVQYLQQETESYLAGFDPNYRQTLAKSAPMPITPVNDNYVNAPVAQAAPYSTVSTHELAPPPPALAPMPAFIPGAQAAENALFVQVASFSIEDNAHQMAERLTALGTVEVAPVDIGSKVWYRVRLGPLFDRISAENMLARVGSLGVSGARITHN